MTGSASKATGGDEGGVGRMSTDRERAPWWGATLPPVEGNAPPVQPLAPGGLWDGVPPPPSGTGYGHDRLGQGFGDRHGGLPSDGIRSGVPGGSRKVLWLVALVAALIGAVIGGVVGGVVGSETGDTSKTVASAPLTNPSITLPVSGPVNEPNVPRTVPAGSVAAIAAAVVPSVVTVHIRTGTQGGTGAGVIISSDGYIMTNNHVVAINGKTGTLTVDLSAARTNIPARIVGRSPLDDLAVIKVDVTGLSAARLGRSADLLVGDLVVAVGAPLGLSGSVTSGIVSALARNIEVPSEDGTSTTILGNAIQTDAAINPGNSGGALVDSDGSVVGINSAIASTGNTDSGTQAGSIGVGFAIPIDYARAIAQQIIRTGKATHPFLGVLSRTVDPVTAARGQPALGAYIVTITKDSPAANAGLQVGDVITLLNGQLVTSADDLIGMTRTHQIGESVTVTYVRKGQTATAQVKLAQNPND